MAVVRVKKVQVLQTWGVKNPDGTFKPMYDKCVDKYVPGLNAETGYLRTGLSTEERVKFENDLELEEGELKTKSQYWSSFFIPIPAEGLLLKTTRPMDALKYKLLLNDPEVAKNKAELKTNIRAKYVIVSEEIEAKASNNLRDIKTKAFVTYAKLSQVEVLNALTMFGLNSSTMNMEIARDRLGEIVEKNPAKFLEVVGDKLFKDKVWMLLLLKKGIVTKRGMGVGLKQPLYFNDVLLGNNLEECILFVKSKENQNIYMGLKEALKSTD